MNGLLRPAAFSHRYLCGLLAAIVGAGPALPVAAQEVRRGAASERAAPADQQGNLALLADPAVAPVAELNLQYTLPDAAVIVAARPKQMFQSAALEMLPLEVLQAAAKQEFNVDVLELDQLVATVSPPVQGPPSYAMYGHFAVPAELRSANIDRQTDAAEIAGRAYRRARGPMEPSVYQPDNQSLLLTPDPALQQFVAEGEKPPLGRLAAQVAAAAKSDDLFVMVDVEAVRPLLSAGLAQAGIPRELQSLQQLPNLLRAIELRVNLSNPGITELVATANNAGDAQQIVGIVDGLKQQVRDKTNEEIQRLLNSGDPVEAAFGRYQKRMLGKWDEWLQLQVDGDRLTMLRLDPSQSGGNSQVMGVAIAGVLVALLLPAVQAAREAARRNQSLNNMKQIMLAMHNYYDTRKSFPAQANFDDNGKPLLSWRVHILPFIEEQALYEQFHLDEPWDSEHNLALVEKMPQTYLDPSSVLAPTDGRTHYLGVVGEGLAFDRKQQGRTFPQIRDGTSNTIAVVQVNDQRASIWTKPEDWSPGKEGAVLDGLTNGPHPGTFIAGFFDGHCRSMSEAIDADLFLQLLTVAGGEVVNDF